MSSSKAPKSTSQSKPDRNGFRVGDEVFVLMMFDWEIRRGVIVKPVLGMYHVRFPDGKESYTYPSLIRRVEDVPQPILFWKEGRVI